MKWDNLCQFTSLAEIKDILVRRDNISELEAWCVINDCIDELRNAVATGDYDAAADAIQYHLRLEPDYLDVLMMGNDLSHESGLFVLLA